MTNRRPDHGVPPIARFVRLRSTVRFVRLPSVERFIGLHTIARFVRSRPIALAGLAAAMLLFHGTPHAETATSSTSEDVVLATVNGDSIATRHLDAALISQHRQMDAMSRANFDYRKLLAKLINDRLILQEAEDIGMDQEPEMRRALDEILTKEGVRRYLAKAFVVPDSVPESDLRAFHMEYYRRIQLRQITARTPEEARELIARIRAGADMDSLARAVSLDPLRNRGGLSNLIPWVDVENLWRDASSDLETGGISEPFPRKDAWSFIRVEAREPVDPGSFETYRNTIRKWLLAQRREQAWNAFLEERRAEAGITVDPGVLHRIAADSTRLYSPEFYEAGVDVPAIRAEGDLRVSEYELRKAVAHLTMRSGNSPVDSLLKRSVDVESARLALEHSARAAGALKDPETLLAFSEKRDQKVIEAYLAEMIASKIVFKREEFDAYYDLHKEEFRGPEEVELLTLVFEEQAAADEVADRLARGADFDHVRKQLGQSTTAGSAQGKWSPVEVFSAAVRDELARIEPGQTTPPIAIGSTWAIFKLNGRRPGSIQDISDVEMRIRQVLFQRRFAELLDAHLEALKEDAEIRLDEEAIARYFEG